MRISLALALCAAGLMLSGCLAMAVGGAAVGAAGAVVGGTVKATGAVVRAVIPGDSHKTD
jgi:hypothetical protein